MPTTLACTSDNLDNGIHPVLALSKFRTLEFLHPGATDLIKPALQAASLILTNMTQDFWLSIEHGDFSPGEEGSPATFRRHKTTAQMSHQDRRAVAAMFDRLTEYVRSYSFLQIDVFGMMQHRIDIHGKDFAQVKLNMRLLEDIKTAENAEARERALFILTITLLPELAHASNCMLQGPHMEAFFEDDFICEIGEAYENQLLGGIPGVRSGKVLLTKWPGPARKIEALARTGGSAAKATKSGLPKQETKLLVVDGDVGKVFSRAFWKDIFERREDKLHLMFNGGITRVYSDHSKWRGLLKWELEDLIPPASRSWSTVTNSVL